MVGIRKVVLLAVVAGLLSVAVPSANAQTCGSLQALVDAAAPGSTVLVPACTYHETIQINQSITLDGGNHAIIDGDNTRDRWVWINASNVTVKNFTMRNANTAQDEGALGTQAGFSNNTISNNILGPTTNGFPVGVGGGTGTKVLNNDISGGGQLGILSWQDQNLLIQGNHVYNNNTANVDPGYAAGGMKVMNGSGVITGNEVDHNAGPAIWIDIQENGMTITNNNVHDQAWNPILYEVSSRGEISGNTVSASQANAYPPGGNWGCIISSSSGNMNVHDNTCVDTLPILVLYDNRTDRPTDAGTNIKVQNNTVVRPIDPPQATRWWEYDSTLPFMPGQSGNIDSGNVMLQNLPTPTSVPTATPVPPTATPKPILTPTAVPTPTVTCQVEVWINGVSQGRKKC